MIAPELNKIEVGNELAGEELSLIKNLDTKAFDVDTNKDDKEELRTALKTTTINVVTSASDVAKVTEAKTLVEIATQFDQYVEKGDGWKLKVIEGKTDTPAWIKHIIENPQNNDLAYFVQKLAKLIEYQTATAYTETEINAVEVGIDKSFGNQTRRALKGLKSWIESDQDYKTVVEGGTYTGKYVDGKFLEGVISTKNTADEKTAALKKYNLQYKDEKIQPADGYKFIDENSTNYATQKKGANTTTSGETKKIDEATAQTQEKTAVNIDTSKELDTDMYDTYTYNIEKIKTSDFINKYKTEYPGITKLFEGELLQMTHRDNPYFQIRYKNINIDASIENNTQTGKISMRDCMDDAFNFDQDKFFQKLLEGIKPTIEANIKQEINTAILNGVRGKTFSKNELFGNEKDKDGRYTAYFDTFDNNLVEIDAGEQYTKIDGDTLLFRLDNDGLDKEYNKNLSIAINKITNDKGQLDEKKSKKELASIISKIIDNNLS